MDSKVVYVNDNSSDSDMDDELNDIIYGGRKKDTEVEKKNEDAVKPVVVESSAAKSEESAEDIVPAVVEPTSENTVKDTVTAVVEPTSENAAEAAVAEPKSEKVAEDAAESEAPDVAKNEEAAETEQLDTVGEVEPEQGELIVEKQADKTGENMVQIQLVKSEIDVADKSDALTNDNVKESETEIEKVQDDIQDDIQDEDDTLSVDTQAILNVDPLYFRLTKFLQTNDGEPENVAQILKKINTNLETMNGLIEKVCTMK